MSNEKFFKVKLEKEDIQETKRKSCCGKICLRKVGSKGICTIGEKYFSQIETSRSAFIFVVACG
jgi:hypothetical protein